MATQGICIYSGIPDNAGWEFVYGPGVDPSVCVITTLSRFLDLPRIGTLRLEQDGHGIVFPRCRVVSRTLTSGRAGIFVKVAIEDRRWYWRYSQIDGSYNKRLGAEILRKKTPQELATLLWQALGESGFSVDKLPNDKGTNPIADWQGVAAAPLLSQLCHSLGCFPTLNPLTNKAEIARIGEGRAIPRGGRVMREGGAAKIRTVPDSVRFVTGPALFQVKFDLEAVGVDTDGTVKPVDDLSYKPSAGWNNIDPQNFYGVEGTYEKDGETFANRSLAKSSVWRMYRVKGITGGGFSLKSLEGGDYKTDKLKDFLPLRSTRLTTKKDSDGLEKEEPYLISGTYALPEQQAVFTGQDNATNKEVPIAWSRMDGKKAIVYFSLPMYFWGQGNAVKPATLTLETSFIVNNDGIKVRHEEFRNTEGQTVGTGPLLFRRSDLVRKVVERDGKIEQDNAKEIKKEADYYIEQWARTLGATETKTVQYSRILRWGIDGLTRQITWSGSGGRVATTTVSINGEHNTYVQSYQVKAKQLEADRIAKESEFLLGFNREFFEGFDL